MSTDPNPTQSTPSQTSPSAPAPSRKFKPRELQLADGGRLVLNAGVSSAQLDGGGNQTNAWAPADPDVASHAIRFGLYPQDATVPPSASWSSRGLNLRLGAAALGDVWLGVDCVGLGSVLMGWSPPGGQACARLARRARHDAHRGRAPSRSALGDDRLPVATLESGAPPS